MVIQEMKEISIPKAEHLSLVLNPYRKEKLQLNYFNNFLLQYFPILNFINKDDKRYVLTHKKVAWYPSKSVVAVATEANIIQLYDSNKNMWSGNHIYHESFDGDNLSLTWLDRSDILVLGCKQGIMIYFINLNEFSDKDMFSMRFIPHHRPISQIASLSTSGLYATLSLGDTCLYIWNCHMNTSEPVYCSDGTRICYFQASPLGLYMSLFNDKGDVFIVNTYDWKHQHVTSLKDINSLSWLGASTCLLLQSNTCRLYYFTVSEPYTTLSTYTEIMDRRRDQTVTVPMTKVIPTPIHLPPNEDILQYVADRSQVVGWSFHKVVTSKNGMFLAVSYQYTCTNKTDDPAVTTSASSSSSSTISAVSSGNSATKNIFVPCIIVYCCKMNASLLSLTPIRIIKRVKDTIDAVAIDFEFTDTNTSSLKIEDDQLHVCVLWSDDTMTLEPLI